MKDIDPCPTCGALPCDWVNDPHTVSPDIAALLALLARATPGWAGAMVAAMIRNPLPSIGHAEEQKASDVATAKALADALPAIRKALAKAPVSGDGWRAEMPTIWEDPAGKGYPCFERPMTPSEAKDTIDWYGRMLAKLQNALNPFADIRADDGDTFATYPSDMLVRCEASVREILAARAAIAALTEPRLGLTSDERENG